MRVLRSWHDLPECMRNESVYPYYAVLQKHRLALAIKRVFDIAASLILLGILWPVFLVLAVMIKADSRGPVFFRQTRITQYGKEFRIFKFRTMVSDAAKAETQVTVTNDSRITNAGRRIRNCRLDELPQLFNVLSGDMSFVGTRPEVPKYVTAYSPEMHATLLLPAGITSVASIVFKDEAELMDGEQDVDTAYIQKVLPEKMRYNLAEIKDFSLINQLVTMLQTIRAVL